ncbi:MAG: arginine--tRNA ligase [SAR324 cluster bacterium]|nr:arginine--tRNA ligase [SAR324 cluster bacterium]
MNLFTAAIVSLIRGQLAGLASPPEIPEGLVERPPDAAMGDYAFPCFVLAKALRKAPPAIAQQLAAALAAEVAAHPLLRSVEAAGPYLNFRVDPAEMARRTLPAILDGSYFRRNAEAPREPPREKVMVEYSQPNTHKAFHVGHMRNVALGDALVRIFRYNGIEAIAVNYIGDVGTHIARCLWYIRHRAGEPPTETQARGEWLGEQYTAATALLENAPEAGRAAYDREISAVLQQLEAREGEAAELWQETRQWSLDTFEEIYGWLDAHFDHVFYESEMDRPGKEIVAEGLERGVFVRSAGAVGIDLEPEQLGFLLVLKGDGTTLYATKDLALARIKFERFGIGRSIYVVGAEQTLHFKQVFKTLERLGFPQAERSVHLPYGLVMLPEGKMSSRAGNVILFSRLRREMRAYLLTHYLEAHRGDWTDEEIEETARRIAVAAIRYGMAKQDPAKSIVFNLEDWLQTEGDTGTYLCYTYTRICGVQRHVTEPPRPGADFSLLGQPTEQALIRELHDFNRTVARAEANLRPNMVAGALFQICKEFSRTYETSPVKQAPTPELRDARLALFAATGQLLKEGLALLGITPPERM